MGAGAALHRWFLLLQVWTFMAQIFTALIGLNGRCNAAPTSPPPPPSPAVRTVCWPWLPKVSSSYLFPASLNHTDLLGVFPVQLVTLHPPRTDQEQSQYSFIEGSSHTTSNGLPLDTLFVVLTGEDKPLICHPWKVLPLSHTLSPHNVSPFQKLAIPFSGTASQCNLLRGVPPWGIGVGEGQI